MADDSEWYEAKDYFISKNCLDTVPCCQHYVKNKKTGQTQLMFANKIYRMFRWEKLLENHRWLEHFEYYANVSDFGIVPPPTSNMDEDRRTVLLEKIDDYHKQKELETFNKEKYTTSVNRLDKVKAKNNVSTKTT